MESSAKITKSLRKEDVQKAWYVVDAAGQTLGRLATQVAVLLRGKHKPTFTAHVDCGDYVIVINADKVQLQGKRKEQKSYFRHTGYLGGGIVESFDEKMAKKPEFPIEHAVKGMLPKNRLGAKIFNNLKVYAGNEHPHAAQLPVAFELNS